jgi:hypothetical protein
MKRLSLCRCKYILLEKPLYFAFTIDKNRSRWLHLSSNSTCSICCGFVVRQGVQQIHNKSTTFRQIHNISTCQDVVDLLWTLQQIHNKSKQWSMAFDLSTTNRNAVEQIEKPYNKAIQQIHNFTTSHTACCTTNPQQIHNKSN